MVLEGWGIPGWEQLPEWIAAGVAALTLGAAVAAGYYAKQAAHWTKDQAESAKRQTVFADEQTALAKQALELARREAAEARAVAAAQQAQAERAEQRLEQSRMDALAPVIYARATQGGSLSPNRHPIEQAVPGTQDWVGIGGTHEFDQAMSFRTNLTLGFTNVSSVVAKIEFRGQGCGTCQDG